MQVLGRSVGCGFLIANSKYLGSFARYLGICVGMPVRIKSAFQYICKGISQN
jgi:hypothetical protein